MVPPDALTIAAGEHGVVRVFALDMPAEQAQFLREPGAADQLLGVTGLDPDQIDIFNIADMQELGLTGYLAEGLGIPRDQITANQTRIDTLSGWIMVLRSRAFQGHPMTLKPAAGLTLVAQFLEPGTNWTATPMQTDSAKPYSGPRVPPRQARGEARRIGAILFAVVMALIVLVLALVIS